MATIGAEDLARLETSVCRALDGRPVGHHGADRGPIGDDSTGTENRGLTILGHGEITLVIGWPSEAPVLAVKRLPPFADRERADRYGHLVLEYVEELARRGVRCVETAFQITETSGGWAAYVVQPLLDPETLGPTVLRRLDTEDPSGTRARDLIERITTAILAATDDRVGLDGQLSNWADTADGLRYFDVTTPLLKDDSGQTRLDLQTLTRPLPAPMRPLVRRFLAPGITSKYHDPRSVLLDLAANLHKERLDRWINATLVSANPHLSSPITPQQTRDYYRSDARTWEALLRLRLADRWLHRHVLHRRYDALLPLRVER